jgi:HEAT repeat protein
MVTLDPMWMKTQVIEGLINSLKDKDEDRDLRIQSAETLGKTLCRKGTYEGALEERAVRALTEALKDEDEKLRKAAREALDIIKAKQS